ncbi:MAG: HAMP domain-containing histidine kinase [Candidatus Omnitrophica bacterium]|nr:HAMP domain-containing histidine kinase [Candidatus Omnitrophota bacterium]MBI3010000.1 HAMP domain-containing histidine kinase [Candidatus Omnitrophota bacterium]
MSIIPLLICLYLITVKFWSLKALEGLNGIYFLMAVLFALLGLVVGREVIRDIIHQLVEANQKLQRLYNQQAAFVNNVAHEFRAPLTVFKGAIDNMADGLYGPLSADQDAPVRMCQKEINRLKRLVTDLLDIARIEAGKLKLNKEPVVLQEVITTTIQMMSGFAKERNLELSAEMPEGPIIVSGDRDRLQQVFINLISNAIKFTKWGGICVRLLRPAQGNIVIVEVEDTGPGIEHQDLERIFDKFERVGSDSEEGSGLGLPIAKDIIILHRGRIWVESDKGHGSRFLVQLPV